MTPAEWIALATVVAGLIEHYVRPPSGPAPKSYKEREKEIYERPTP
jgi:hypothetical protein